LHARAWSAVRRVGTHWGWRNGERPTDEQVDAFEAAQKRLFVELEALVVVARRETGNAPVALPLRRAELAATRSVEHDREADQAV
jgi:hypothetical protein